MNKTSMASATVLYVLHLPAPFYCPVSFQREGEGTQQQPIRTPSCPPDLSEKRRATSTRSIFASLVVPHYTALCFPVLCLPCALLTLNSHDE